jgi:hypothetical protein
MKVVVECAGFLLAGNFSCILEEECKDGKGDGDGDEVGG